MIKKGREEVTAKDFLAAPQEPCVATNTPGNKKGKRGKAMNGVEAAGPRECGGSTKERHQLVSNCCTTSPT